MEIFELKYFLAVAIEENVHRASESIHVSAASLSKAIARLEDELGRRLFLRKGRHIRLTDEGRHLRARAQEILGLEESVRLELSGGEGALNVTFAGTETMLSAFGLPVVDKITKRYPRARFEFLAAEGPAVLKALETGAADLALVSSAPPAYATKKKIADVKFQTCVGKGHPFFNEKRIVPVEEVLEHAFVSPSRPIWGHTNEVSDDGWRDDKFPRRIGYRTASLKVLESVVLSGKAIAYLPDYSVRALGENAWVLRVSGCPYTCEQEVTLISNPRIPKGWVNQVT